MDHKNNIDFKSQWKYNQNHILWMRHLFVTTSLPQIGDHTKANKQARENESNRRQWMKQEQFEANQHKGKAWTDRNRISWNK